MEQLKRLFETYLASQIPDKKPGNLYTPLHYILQNGGKRIRPMLVLLSAQSFGKKPEIAMPAASAIEIFHNFTLIHDDIMDQSDIRRGKPTVHKKWNENIAILAGDTMMIWAYKTLEKYEAETYKKLNTLLIQTAIEVCEGQQMDMDFESKTNVKIQEYLEMIRLKTAVLLGTALQFGGIVAKTSTENLKNINDFGEKLGLAFQIQDDYLDTYGDTSTFGKKIGRDIIDRKKTFLYITALNRANSTDKQILIDLYQDKSIDEKKLIETTTTLFNKYNIPEISLQKINEYTNKALLSLSKIDFEKEEIDFWKNFALNLINREK